VQKARTVQAIERGDSLSGADVPFVCPTGVMGALEQMPLTEILQSMDFGKKTGRVDVHFDEHTSGLVHVVEGQILRAMAWTPEGEWTGELAFVEMCRRRVGYFRIEYVRDDVERNVQRPTTFVLLEAMRVIDEAQSAGGSGEDPQLGPDEPWGPSDSQEELARLDDPSEIEIDVASSVNAVADLQPVQQHPRYKVGVPIDIATDSGTPEPALLEDIGLGGAYVGTDLPLKRGDRLWLRIPSGSDALVVPSAVAHVLEASAAITLGRPSGVGVTFAALEPPAEQALRAYVDALSREREASSPSSTQTEREKLLNCLAESEFLVAAGDLASAQRVLKQATGLAPTDDDVRRRLMKVNESIDAAQANALLERALRGAPNAVDLARRATQLRPARDVLLRSLGVFARAGAHDEIADVAEQLLELDPNDEGALRTLLDANISMERWIVAAQAAQALVRKHPQDAQLQEKLQKVLQQARRPV
jgi:Domain of unknown function (DUF4388)/PilZ domain